MTQRSSYYKHFIPKIKLSIEKGTNLVPNDGNYYIVSDGCVIDNFTSLKRAEERFKQLVEERGYKPKPIKHKKPKADDQ